MAAAPSASTLASCSSSVISDATSSSSGRSSGRTLTPPRLRNTLTSTFVCVGGGAGSGFADSGISDGCSNDVVLNEIHRQRLRP